MGDFTRHPVRSPASPSSSSSLLDNYSHPLKHLARSCADSEHDHARAKARIGADNYATLERNQRARDYQLYDSGPRLEYNFLPKAEGTKV